MNHAHFRQAVAGASTAIPHPGGMNENSPTFQGWVPMVQQPVSPAGIPHSAYFAVKTLSFVFSAFFAVISSSYPCPVVSPAPELLIDMLSASVFIPVHLWFTPEKFSVGHSCFGCLGWP